MPKVCYVEKRFSQTSLKIIAKANEIIEEFEAQGYSLTLRQLFYQFVARDIIPNTNRSYKNLGGIINDARLAGLIDWNHITDRTRFVRKNSHWKTPGGVIQSAAEGYRIDMWARQDYRPQVWIEKDALVGVIADVCAALDVPYLSCRGYTSQSEMWGSSQRIEQAVKQDQIPVVFHLGDHDPSGKDMTRDIDDRLKIFMGGCRIERLALNMDQVEEFKPPPNPTKVADTRSTVYIAEFGNNSWELDALEPKIIANLVRDAVTRLVDKKKWSEDEARWTRERKLLFKAAKEWPRISKALRGRKFP